ncbi:hypothetical protein PTKU46_82760 [Paraburkholderia terrae]
MGGVFCWRDADGHERWWLEALGKGDKERLAPAPTEMMVELGRYRRERGLSARSSRHEDTPLVLSLGPPMKPLTRAALHRIVKAFFAGAAERLRLRGDSSRARRICSNRLPHTSCATPQDRAWPTAMPISAPCAKESDTPAADRRVSPKRDICVTAFGTRKQADTGACNRTPCQRGRSDYLMYDRPPEPAT